MDLKSAKEISRIPKIAAILSLILISSLELFIGRYVPTYDSETTTLVLFAISSVVILTSIMLVKPNILFLNTRKSDLHTKSNPPGSSFLLSLMFLPVSFLIVYAWILIETTTPEIGEFMYSLSQSPVIWNTLKFVFFSIGIFVTAFHLSIILRRVNDYISKEETVSQTEDLLYSAAWKKFLTKDQLLTSEEEDFRNLLAKEVEKWLREEITNQIRGYSEKDEMGNQQQYQFSIYETDNWDYLRCANYAMDRVYREKLARIYQWPMPKKEKNTVKSQKKPEEKKDRPVKSILIEYVLEEFSEIVEGILISTNIDRAVIDGVNKRGLTPIFIRNLSRYYTSSNSRFDLSSKFASSSVSIDGFREQFERKYKITGLLVVALHKYGFEDENGVLSPVRFNHDIFKTLVEKMNVQLFPGDEGKLVDGLDDIHFLNSSPFMLQSSESYQEIIDKGVKLCKQINESYSFPNVARFGNLEYGKIVENEMAQYFEDIGRFFK